MPKWNLHFLQRGHLNSKIIHTLTDIHSTRMSKWGTNRPWKGHLFLRAETRHFLVLLGTRGFQVTHFSVLSTDDWNLFAQRLCGWQVTSGWVGELTQTMKIFFLCQFLQDYRHLPVLLSPLRKQTFQNQMIYLCITQEILNSSYPTHKANYCLWTPSATLDLEWFSTVRTLAWDILEAAPLKREGLNHSVFKLRYIPDKAFMIHKSYFPLNSQGRTAARQNTKSSLLIMPTRCMIISHGAGSGVCVSWVSEYSETHRASICREGWHCHS